MRKKFFVITILAFLVILSAFAGSVRAEESQVSHREMAIAAALCWVPPEEGNTLSGFWKIDITGKIGQIVNDINEKFNLNGFADIEELDDWIVDSVYGGKTLGVIDKKGTSGFTLKRDKDLIIVFTSTNGPQDVFDDIVGYGLANASSQEPYANEYLKQVIDKYAAKSEKYNIYVVGHSLGGYLAQTAGATAEKLIKENSNKYKNLQIKQIVSFNGIGINFRTEKGDKENFGNKKEIIETLKKIGNEGRVICYYTYGDFVSSLGVHYGEMRMLYPSIDSISSQRLYSLGKANVSSLISLLEKVDSGWFIFEKNTYKTEINKTQNLYQVGNFISYFCLTHVADTFATIDLEEAAKRANPVVKITEKKLTSLISLNKEKEGLSSLETNKDVVLQAKTYYAGVKKYEWYVSDNGNDWTLLKKVDLYNLNGVVPENTLDIDINTIAAGATKYYKVISYYDDNYVSQSIKYDEKTGEYKYVENQTKSKKEADKKVEATIKIKNKKSSTSLTSKISLPKIKTILTKVSTIKSKINFNFKK